MSEEQQILSDYQKYDFLNQEERPLVKIFVNYIKPAFLFKTKILTPMHLGRAVETENSKLGTVSEQDLNWLHKNCVFNDDFEGGISEHNRRIGFLTGTYCAWKNYEKLGNSEYFGSFGYRRLLSPDFLADIANYDIVIPKIKEFKIESIKDQFINYHGQELYESMLGIFAQIYPQEIEALKKYFDKTSGYFDEIYVMRKKLFFEFCEWIFPLLFAFLKMPLHSNSKDTRDIAFIMERLTGYYLYQLTQRGDIKYKEENVIITEEMKMNKKNINKNLFAKLRSGIK